eukprot:151961-Chlamydomonas_euryale.AAC.1
MANLLVAQLLYLDSVDDKKDVTMYINSPGGSVTAGARGGAVCGVQGGSLHVCRGLVLVLELCASAGKADSACGTLYFCWRPLAL